MPKKKKKKSLNLQIIFLSTLFLVASALFLPTTMILLFGMMPTIALFMGDKSEGKLRTLAIGLINFAGTAYVLMQLWTKEHSFEFASQLMMSPDSLIIMYAAAGCGYIIQSVVSVLVASIVLQQTQGRMEKIKDLQEDLEVRWGHEVTGKIPLDSYGFPIEEDDPKTDKKPEDTIKK